MDITLSIIKADTGGFVGHTDVHPEMLEVARTRVSQAIEAGLVIDGHVNRVGDDLALIMTHTREPEDPKIHTFAWDLFQATTEEVSCE